MICRISGRFRPICWGCMCVAAVPAGSQLAPSAWIISLRQQVDAAPVNVAAWTCLRLLISCAFSWGLGLHAGVLDWRGSVVRNKAAHSQHSCCCCCSAVLQLLLLQRRPTSVPLLFCGIVILPPEGGLLGQTHAKESTTLSQMGYCCCCCTVCPQILPFVGLVGRTGQQM